MFRRETNFSQTPIGSIPKEWQVARLGDIAKINRESCDPSREFPEDRFLYIDIESIEAGSGRIKEAKMIIGKNAPSRARRVIHKDDVLMSTVRPYLKAFTIVANEYENEICSTGFAVLTSKEEMNPRYLMYSLFSDTFVSQCNRIMVGGQYPALNSSQVSEIQLPIPPMSEQRGIVEVLSVVDSAIELADKVVAKTERLKKGLMKQLLTRGIGHTEYKDTPIGKTPKTWQIVRLEDVSEDFIGGGTPSTFNPEYWNGDIAWMTSAHINGRLITKGQKYITKKGVENSATNIVPRNNLLVSTRVGIGKAAINKIDIAISQDLTGVIINEEKALSEFLYWVLIHSERKLKALAQGSTIKGILREELGRLHIPLPPIAEQERICEILSTADKKLELEMYEKTRLERVKRGLMDLLLTGKIRVKVD
jgi:type I restriction enzyme S subunit